MSDALLRTALPFPVRRGKVRDVYDLGERLLIVATDRISAFDVIMPNGIPDKGKLLTQLTLHWFRLFCDVPHHLLSDDPLRDGPPALATHAAQLAGRSMIVRKAQVIPVECVARGYLAGSGWKEYRLGGAVCGVPLPDGLMQASRLPEPIFTPATKEESGHDQNIDFARMGQLIGADLARTLRRRTLDLYNRAADHARERGIIIADAKFEFGMLSDGSVILIDEILTPDSSRFWPADLYAPGREQASFDKQFLRDWLESQAWDKGPPAPLLPDEVVEGTRRRYLEAFEKLTGQRWG